MHIRDKMNPLLDGDIRKGLIRLTIPLIFGNILQQCYNIADSLIIGRCLGTEAFAAIGVAGTVMTMMIFILSGGCSGLTTVFSMLYGKGDYEGFRREFFITAVFGGMLALFVSLACMAGMTGLLRLIQTPEELFRDVRVYLNIIAGGMLGIYYYNLLSSILRSLGNTRAPLYFLLLAVCVNVFLDVLLIIGCSMGIAGAAFGTVISQMVSSICCFAYLRRVYPELVFGKRDIGLHRTLMYRSCAFAFSSAFSMSALYIGKILVQGAVNALGISGIAAFAAASRLEDFTNTFSSSCGAAIHVMVSQNIGAGNQKRAIESLKKGIGMNLTVTLGTAGIIAMLAKPGLSLFLEADNGSALRQGELYLRIVAVFYVFCVFGDSLGGNLRGAGKIFAPILATLLNIVPRVLLAPYFTRRWAVPGLGFATGISWIMLTLGMFMSYMRQRNENPGGRTMSENQTLNTIFGRSSYRGAFQREPVPRDDLLTILKAGAAAPSGCNRQTASFIAVDEETLLQEIKSIFPNPSCRTAPAFILTFTQEIAAAGGHYYNVQDYGAAIENMLLAIKSMGYETCWYEGSIRGCAKEISELLNVPEERRLVCLLPVGKAEEEATEKAVKKDFTERAWFNGFGK